MPKRQPVWLGYLIWTILFVVAGLPSASRLPEAPGPWATAVLLGWGVAHAFALVAVIMALGALAPSGWRGIITGLGALATVWVTVSAFLMATMGQPLRPEALRHLTQEAALTTLGISSSELLLGLGTLGVVVGLGFWATRARPDRRRAALIALAAVVIDGSCSVAGMLARYEGLGALTGLHEAIPLAWAPRADLQLSRLLGHPPRALESTFLFPDDRFEPLRRPLAKQHTPTLPRHTDVLLVVVESLRADAVSEMPALSRFARDAVVGERHYSAGNCTLVGAFSLYTGLSPMFMAADGAWASGGGLDAFRRAGYDVKLGASASLNMELPKLIFADPTGVVEGKVLDDIAARDDQNVERAMQWLRESERGGRLFALFIDGTHWPYTQGAAPPLDDSWLVRAQAGALHARYLDAVRAADARLAPLLEAASKRAEDLVVVVTADHGEAFGEHGVLMHGSRLDDEQLRVPLVMRLPGVTPRTIPGPSVHQDVLPTVLAYLGAELGDDDVDLLSKTPRKLPPVVGCCGFAEPVGYALLRGGDKVLVGLSRQHGLRYRGLMVASDVVLPNAPLDPATADVIDDVELDFLGRLR